MKYFIGTMSKNVVDAILQFNDEVGDSFGLLPSRRQVEYNGGYVNDWNTEEFHNYVRYVSMDMTTLIERDHAGAGQGYVFDDGYESLKEDCVFADIIHIDPWKNHQGYSDGLKECIKYIEFCYYTNRYMKFEVGTEESIRKFSVIELDSLLIDLSDKLSDDMFDNIEYVVVQSGVGLDLANMRNTGNFNPYRLEKMIDVSKKFGKKSKEHNGDYLSINDYNKRFDMGLDSVNIAPEFGQLETLIYLNHMDSESISKWYDICLESKRWEKWVDEDFDISDKKRLIQICGHYLFSDNGFKKIKPDIDNEIIKEIKYKLGELQDDTR
jgi:D-tagatose-1,6-bisphosphate aldolase subunit GatZ/KbaZ